MVKRQILNKVTGICPGG